MKNFLLLIFVLPFLGFGQGNYKSSAKKLFKQAGLEYQAGNNLAALDLYKKCVGEEPSFAEAYLNMANIEFNDKVYTLNLVSIYKHVGTNYAVANDLKQEVCCRVRTVLCFCGTTRQGACYQ